MRGKYGLKIFWLVFFFLVFPASAWGAGGDVEWQIMLKDNKAVAERLFIKNPWPELENLYRIKIDVSKNELLIERETKDFEAYKLIDTSFPLDVKVKNRILWDNYIIKSDYENNQYIDELLAKSDKIMLSLQIPGIIRDSSADKTEGNTLTWIISSEKKPDIFASVAVIDGFNLALVILGIGILLALFYFISSILKVNRIIEEEYSIADISLYQNEPNLKKEIAEEGKDGADSEIEKNNK